MQKNKIFKWIMWALIIISVIIVVWGFAAGFTAGNYAPVSSLLNWAYVMIAATILIVVIGGLGIAAANNPKSLIKFGIGIVVVAVICAIAYATASGSPAVGYVGNQPSHAALKLTDTILNLTYLIGALAILGIAAGEIVTAVRNK